MRLAPQFALGALAGALTLAGLAATPAAAHSSRDADYRDRDHRFDRDWRDRRHDRHDWWGRDRRHQDRWDRWDRRSYDRWQRGARSCWTEWRYDGRYRQSYRVRFCR